MPRYIEAVKGVSSSAALNTELYNNSFWKVEARVWVFPSGIPANFPYTNHSRDEAARGQLQEVSLGSCDIEEFRWSLVILMVVPIRADSSQISRYKYQYVLI